MLCGWLDSFRPSVPLRAALDETEHLEPLGTCWSLPSRMLCVWPDSWDFALKVGSEKQLSSYSLDLGMPLS